MKRFKLWSLFFLFALIATQPVWAEEKAPEKAEGKADERSEEDKDKDDNDPGDVKATIDYTKLKTEPGNLKWVFGPTGFYGWTDRGSKQIYVKDVDANSPSSNVLKKGDVILGVVSPKKKSDSAESTSKLFSTSDARKEFAEAITEAEKNENRGRLVLNVWRDGKTFEAPIIIRVMGTYSETAPEKCPKTAQIIALSCNYLKEHGLNNGITGCLDALGLLSTGRPEYLPMIRELAQKLARNAPDSDEGSSPWFSGYKNLFLTEYYLATRDATVLPGIKQYAESIAISQGQCGLWSHGAAPPIKTENGLTNGILVAYGAMNSASLPCAISLVLSQKCGIKSARVDYSVNKFANHLRWYIDKGAIPYGDHDPGLKHAANGKNAMAAVFFDLLGDEHGADYFGRCAVASYNEVEGGHTGNYWSFAWSAIGAGCVGEEAAAAFMREIRWYHELERRWDGSIRYQGQMSAKDHLKYGNWSIAGARLIHYTLSNRALYITGKGGRAAKPVVGAELESVLAAGKFDDRDRIAGVSTEELLKGLGSWSPVVRDRSGLALNKTANIVPKLIELLQGPDRYSRYGACNGLKYCGNNDEKAAELLLKAIETSDDQTLKYHAAWAFTYHGHPSMAKHLKRIAPPLLQYAATLRTDDKMLNVISTVLFYFGSNDIRSAFPFGKGIEQIDKNILIPGMKALLRSTNGGARSCVARAAYDNLSNDDLKLLWGDIFVATRDRSPSNIMFQDGVRAQGLALMAKHGIKEGIPEGLDFISEQRWGSFGRIPSGVKALLPYGGALKDTLDKIKQVIDKRFPKSSEESQELYKLIDKADMTKTQELVSIESQIKAADAEIAKIKKAEAGSFSKTSTPLAPKAAVATPNPVASRSPAPKAIQTAPAQATVSPAVLATWQSRFVKKLTQLASSGKKIRFEDKTLQSGVVRGADEKSLLLEVQGNVLPMPWSWLNQEKRAALARAAASDGDEESLLIAAIMHFANNQNELAEDFLTKVHLKNPAATKDLRNELNIK